MSVALKSQRVKPQMFFQEIHERNIKHFKNNTFLTSQSNHAIVLHCSVTRKFLCLFVCIQGQCPSPSKKKGSRYLFWPLYCNNMYQVFLKNLTFGFKRKNCSTPLLQMNLKSCSKLITGDQQTPLVKQTALKIREQRIEST